MTESAGGSSVYWDVIFDMNEVKAAGYTVKTSHPIFKVMANEYRDRERRARRRIGGDLEDDQTGRDCENK